MLPLSLLFLLRGARVAPQSLRRLFFCRVVLSTELAQLTSKGGREFAQLSVAGKLFARPKQKEGKTPGLRELKPEAEASSVLQEERLPIWLYMSAMCTPSVVRLRIVSLSGVVPSCETNLSFPLSLHP